MPVKGISFNDRSLKALDKLAKSEGESRSGMIARLVERAASANGAPDVRVDGVRYVPSKGWRRVAKDE